MAKTFALPKSSWVIVGIAVLGQLAAIWKVSHLPVSHLANILIAFFASAFLADLVTAFFHFGFDYVWPDNFPVMGPISVEFRHHHDRPMLDPSDLCGNLTRGGYMGFTFALIAWVLAEFAQTTQTQWAALIVLGIALWGFFFHQIHSYSHMGKKVSPDEFNAAVKRISELPRKEQEKEFLKLFEAVGIPKWVRFLQRTRIFLRPEVHWRHHQNFQSDFSSLNGWSDPITNVFFGPIARKRLTERARAADPLQLELQV